MKKIDRKISFETELVLEDIELSIKNPKACMGFDRWLNETVKEVRKTQSLDLLEENIMSILRVLKEYSKIEMVGNKATAEKFSKLHTEVFSLFVQNRFS
jgi:hypothetical protein